MAEAAWKDIRKGRAGALGSRAGSPLKYGPAFWDASALVPLCAGQLTTPRAAAHYKNFELVVWWGTSVEVAAALARLVRMKQLSSKGLAKAQAMALRLKKEWMTVEPSDNIRQRASDLVARYDLRAGDSLQLAAALEWCLGKPHGEVFLTADQRLRQAASLCGFDTKTV